jgi:hypothetical protein
MFDSWSDHVGLVVDKVVLGRISSEYFGFPCRFSFHQLLHMLFYNESVKEKEVEIYDTNLS